MLHDWAFESGTRILGTVARAMTSTAAQQAADVPVWPLLVIAPPISVDFDAARELFQMVACEEGMHGLDEEGMRSLLDAAGFDVRSVRPLPTGRNACDATVRAMTGDPGQPPGRKTMSTETALATAEPAPAQGQIVVEVVERITRSELNGTTPRHTWGPSTVATYSCDVFDADGGRLRRLRTRSAGTGMVALIPRRRR